MHMDVMSLGAWASVGDRCEIDYLVGQGEIELRFGQLGDFTILLTEQALRTLVSKGGSALTTFERASDNG